MISTKPLTRENENFDIILISGEYWADHPQSGVGVIARILESNGYSIGIIEKPNWKSIDDFLKLGIPNLFYGVTSGSIDSMLQNYTPLKKKRSEDPYKPFNSKVPDRAVIVYSQKIKEAQKKYFKELNEKSNSNIKFRKIPVIIGGVEASLRRFTHYDYWDNKVRRSILFDAKADLLVYGPGEYQIIEIANRIKRNESLEEIEGTCMISSKSVEEYSNLTFNNQEYEIIPSHEKVLEDKKLFCQMQLSFSNEKTLVQPVGDKLLIQYRMHTYITEELDALYTLPFTYFIPKKFKEFEMARFSIITHRGCFGNCSFCAIALHQGTKIISRSIENILKEIQHMTQFPQFKGYISDLGGPSANMYGMDCSNFPKCSNNCIECKKLNLSHKKGLELLKKSRSIPKIKKIFVRSGIRYDLAIDANDYLVEISHHHISGSLKIAPEHFSPKVLDLMNKNNSCFDEFREKFKSINQSLKQTLKYYFITAHPGSTLEEVAILRKKINELKLKNCESIQIFTPTPMSLSTCMYYTGLNPFNLSPIYVPYNYNEKKKQKNILYLKNAGDFPSKINNKKNSHHKKQSKIKKKKHYKRY